MFGEVIREVLVCRGPVHMVFLLVDAIADPIEMARDHCWATVSLARPTAVEYQIKRVLGVVVSELFKGGAERGRFFGVVEEDTEFGFGGRGKDHSHYGG